MTTNISQEDIDILNKKLELFGKAVFDQGKALKALRNCIIGSIIFLVVSFFDQGLGFAGCASFCIGSCIAVLWNSRLLEQIERKKVDYIIIKVEVFNKYNITPGGMWPDD